MSKRRSAEKLTKEISENNVNECNWVTDRQSCVSKTVVNSVTTSSQCNLEKSSAGSDRWASALSCVATAEAGTLPLVWFMSENVYLVTADDANLICTADGGRFHFGDLLVQLVRQRRVLVSNVISP